MQVFVGKSGDSTDSSKPTSPCLLKKSFADNPPTTCSTPKANESPASVKLNDYSLDDTNNFSESSCHTDAHVDISTGDIAESSPEELNDMVIIGDPKYNVKADRVCFDKIVKHSSTPYALALNLLDNLIPKEVQRISNIKGTNGKTSLNAMILAAIKGQLKRQYKWSDEELEKNWGGKAGVQQKIANKCRNLNKTSKKNN